MVWIMQMELQSMHLLRHWQKRWCYQKWQESCICEQGQFESKNLWVKEVPNNIRDEAINDPLKALKAQSQETGQPEEISFKVS